ncbi:GNAT family N-acetyltransferase [Ilumatobacter sp.]|uniref:GNAT family N-acetyltransferase n=1 Tax=Ilumatobacter sp. TaxID=1967498 RepID=UPI003B52D932
MARPSVRSARALELAEITPETWPAVGGVSVGWSQRRLVAPVHDSLLAALSAGRGPARGAALAWFRAIVADGRVVGFVAASSPCADADPVLTSILVEVSRQGRGIGRRALELLVDHERSLGHRRLLTVHHVGPGSSGAFFTSLGFAPIGQVHDATVTAVLDL